MTTQDERLDYFFSLLEDSLRVLSEEADAQIRYLQNLSQHQRDAEHVDDLALEFDDAFVYSAQLIETGHISQECYNALKFIDQMLDQMSGQKNAHLWTFAALRTAEEWAKVRASARDAKQQMPPR